ncbi:hypothetical protein ACR0ST_12275 [Aliidiomarina sp. Khilg15.8]
MVKTTHSNFIEKALAVSVFVILMVHNFIWWYEIHWYSEEYLSVFFSLELFVNPIDSFDENNVNTTVAQFIHWSIPLLVLVRRLAVRVLFYIIFIWMNFFHGLSYDELVVMALLSHMLSGLTLVGVGFLLCSDLARVSSIRNNVANIPSNSFYSLVAFLLAVGTVLASLFGAQGRKKELMLDFLVYYPELSRSVDLGAPHWQLGSFIVLCVGVFTAIPDKLRVVLIVLSWIVISALWQVQLEWIGHLYFVSAYIIMSSALVWSLMNNRSLYDNKY